MAANYRGMTSMPFRPLRLLLLVAVVALAAASSAAAATPPRPLLIGFQDESSFLWSPSRLALLERASSAHAGVIRVIANWSQIAPEKPAAPGNSADPAYHFEGLDDLVWQAELRNMRVLLTIWGTPKWASASGKPNAAPGPAVLGSFCSAMASRYSGRGAQPFVGLYSVWNEPNLDQFLSPQFSSKGADLGPKLYAGMARSCVGAIKRANPSAQVAIGDTSPRGSDKPRTVVQASHSPGRFVQLAAPLLRGVRFDAWAHHPYADGFRGGPTSHFRWPNVGIGDLGSFELALRKDFRRREVPLWVTEFAYQTAPEHPGALSYGRQASYLGRSIEAAAAVPDVQMFVWYIFGDTPGARWQSGLIAKSGAPKPSLAVFTRVAAQFDPANPTLQIPARPNPKVPLSVLEFQAHHQRTDPPLGMTYRVFDSSGKLVADAQPQATIDRRGQILVPLVFTPSAGASYTVTFDLNDIHGNETTRHARLIVSR